MLGSLVGALVFITGLPVVAGAGYLLVLVAACWRHRPVAATGTPRSGLAVLVPAHNEAETIADCVRSLLGQEYPRERLRVLVIADNCSDDTAARAVEAGADVLVRNVPQLRGKGHALQWAMERVLAEADPPDALVVVDADARAEPRFLAELEGWLASGHDAVQANSFLQPEPGSARSQLEAAAMLLRARVRYSGLTELGIPAGLGGNGMLLSRQVLQAHPWEAHSPTEDAEHTIKLLLAGVRPVFAARARIWSRTTASERGAYTQGVRWESGRFSAMRRTLPRVFRAALRRRDLLLLVRAVDFAVPPLTILAAITALGTLVAAVLVAAGVIPPLALLPWALAALALPTYVLLGLAAAGAPAETYLAVLALPRFLARKLRIYAYLLAHGGERDWVRTQRPAELREGRDAN